MMTRGQHGPYIHVERHPDGGYFVSKKGSVFILSSYIIIMSLLFVSLYFVRNAHSQLEEVVSAQRVLQQNRASLVKANVDLQDKFEDAAHEISDMRLEVNSLAAKYLPGIERGTLTARETFSGFAIAINQEDYATAYRLTDSEYQATCSSDQFTDVMQSSQFNFPPMKFIDWFLRPDLEVAVLRYETSRDGNTFQADVVLFFENGRWVVPIFNTEDCDIINNDLSPVKSG